MLIKANRVIQLIGKNRIKTFAMNGGHVDQNDQRVEYINAHIWYFQKLRDGK